MLPRDLNIFSKWFSSRTRKPLVLRGARQVGKSTAVRLFAKGMGLKLIEINLERFPHLDGVFKSLNVEQILATIESATGESIQKPNSLLFLDEVQSTPHALAALRYLYEERPGLPIIAAGSLLEFVLSDHEFSMPVGRVEYAWMHPLSFSEFLTARGKNFLAEKLNAFQPGEFWPDPQHQDLMFELRSYMLVGGMPEVVQSYVTGGDEKEIQNLQDNIIATYGDDFSKYASGAALTRLQQAYRRLPQLCGKKIKFAEVLPHEKSANVKSVIELLAKAGIVHRIYHSACDGLPLRAGIDFRVSKVYWLDCGLLNRMQGLTWHVWQQNKKLVYEGHLAEQFVAQELIATQKSADPAPLCYWLREGKSGNSEVDFVVQRGTDLVPIEVKSGASGSLKSLASFMQYKKAKYAIKLGAGVPAVHAISMKLSLADQTVDIQYTLDERPIYLAATILLEPSS
jgi:predicted AAA+ superfamily ATPase